MREYPGLHLLRSRDQLLGRQFALLYAKEQVLLSLLRF
jgi:hypothetical protein